MLRSVIARPAQPYWTNRYPKPVTIQLTGMNLNGGKETDDAGNEYDMDDVKAVARNLLQNWLITPSPSI